MIAVGVCGKWAYPSRAAARQAMRRLARLRTAELGVHWCAECRAWHVTSHQYGKGKWW